MCHLDKLEKRLASSGPKSGTSCHHCDSTDYDRYLLAQSISIFWVTHRVQCTYTFTSGSHHEQCCFKVTVKKLISLGITNPNVHYIQITNRYSDRLERKKG